MGDKQISIPLDLLRRMVHVMECDYCQIDQEWGDCDGDPEDCAEIREAKALLGPVKQPCGVTGVHGLPCILPADHDALYHQASAGVPFFRATELAKGHIGQGTHAEQQAALDHLSMNLFANTFWKDPMTLVKTAIALIPFDPTKGTTRADGKGKGKGKGKA